MPAEPSSSPDDAPAPRARASADDPGERSDAVGGRGSRGRKAREQAPAGAGGATKRRPKNKPPSSTTMSALAGPKPGANLGRLVLPALRGRVGEWVYYCVTMRFHDVAKRIGLATDVHPSRALNELLQRALSERTVDISDYLLHYPEDRFFNSLVVGVYGGAPNWYEVGILGAAGADDDDAMFDDVEDAADNSHGAGGEPYRGPPDELSAQIGDSLGVLVLSGTEELFAIDGQHRVVGIRRALAAAGTHRGTGEPAARTGQSLSGGADAGDDEIPSPQEALANDQVSVIFIAHSKTDEGRERTRRLFSTLNKYAAPVSARDRIAIDEDDIVAILTRDLVEHYPLFNGDKVSAAHTVSIPASDRRSFTHIQTIYTALDTVLRDRSPAEWQKSKRLVRRGVERERYAARAREFWDLVAEHFPPVDAVRQARTGAEVVPKFRHEQGGHFLFRPIGINALSRAARSLTDSGLPLRAALERLAAVPMELDRVPWRGLVWNGRTMLASKTNQAVATRVLYFCAGGYLTPDAEADLRGEVARTRGDGERELSMVRYAPALPPTAAASGRGARRAARRE